MFRHLVLNNQNILTIKNYLRNPLMSLTEESKKSILVIIYKNQESFLKG